VLIDKARIRQLIPHAGPMCLLDAALSWDSERIRCTAGSHRDPANPMRRDGKLRAACGIEYAAQAMALHGALTIQEGKKSRAGVLASVRDLVLHAAYLHDRDNDLVIDVQRLLSDESRVIYQFSLSDGETELVSGRAAVVLDADVASMS
jgi:predicted hotdog family 3-hydroxylacyl-ACP dehydratase